VQTVLSNLHTLRQRFPERLDVLGLIVDVGLLAGIGLSWRLWFPAGRTFPLVPVFTNIPVWVSFILSGFLIASLVIAIVKKHQVAVVIALTLSILPDQMRLQPWVYQYLIMLLLIALNNRRENQLTLSCEKFVVCSLYFWSGLQKFNFNFHHEVLPQLLAPLNRIVSLNDKQLLFLGIVIALIEALTGLGLLLKSTRKVFVWVAVAMHVTVLALLIALRHNSVVWIWNVALALIVLTLFWRVRESTPLRMIGSGFRVRLIQAITVCVVCLPGLNFWNLWDRYLSGALYTGNSPVAVMRIDQPVVEQLSKRARQTVFVSKSGESFLPLLQWSLGELNVPPYPEDRVYKDIARQLCKFSEKSSQVELIVREPRRFSEGFDVKRWNCLTLGGM
jgi:hypothetical protein